MSHVCKIELLVVRCSVSDESSRSSLKRARSASTATTAATNDDATLSKQRRRSAVVGEWSVVNGAATSRHNALSTKPQPKTSSATTTTTTTTTTSTSHDSAATVPFDPLLGLDQSRYTVFERLGEGSFVFALLLRAISICPIARLSQARSALCFVHVTTTRSLSHSSAFIRHRRRTDS